MKRPTLKYVKFVRARNGRDWHGYFDTGNKANGKRVYTPMGLFGSHGFFDRYSTLLGHRSRKQALATTMTVSALMQAYERSGAWSRLAANTQKAYCVTFKRIRAEFGDFPIDALQRHHVRKVIEERITGNASKNLFVSVIGSLYKYARNEEMTDANPIREITVYATGEHQPWPMDLLDCGLSPLSPCRLAISLLYYSGQRIGDVVRMRWGDVQAGSIRVTQQKTGKELFIPLHRELAALLDNTPKRGLTILADEHGRPLKVDRLRNDLQKWAAARGHKVVPHGLRKNAVNALLEAGCSRDEVAAITGQTHEMVGHYARKVDQRRLAKAAIYKMERKAK